MDILPRTFDRDLTLQELLSGVAVERLKGVLTTMLGPGYQLVAADGAVIAEGPSGCPVGADCTEATVRYEFEPVGVLRASTEVSNQIEAARVWLELLAQQTAKYHMASDLHIEVVRQDYEELAQRNVALEASEARYKALSEQLEERVREQVKTIESTQRQLYQTEKLASVGQLAAGVAHEINNPIGFVKSNLNAARGYLDQFRQLGELLQRDASGAADRWRQDDFNFVIEDFHDLLAESLSGVERVARIVADLKSFSNVDQAEEEFVDLNERIRAVGNVAGPQLAQTADLELRLAPLPKLRCRVGHVSQVLLNLLLNASQAMPQRGTIVVETEAMPDAVRIVIRDTGRGIPPEHLSRVFDPFFTTHDVGQGTGLGLTVARDVIRAHGGTIDIQSELGKGTVVTIVLPVRS